MESGYKRNNATDNTLASQLKPHLINKKESMKKYKVRKFFDDHLERVVVSGLSKEEAYKLVEEKERIVGPYTSYDVVEDYISSL